MLTKILALEEHFLMGSLKKQLVSFLLGDKEALICKVCR